MNCPARGVVERESVKFSGLAGGSCAAREAERMGKAGGEELCRTGVGDRESVKCSALREQNNGIHQQTMNARISTARTGPMPSNFAPF